MATIKLKRGTEAALDAHIFSDFEIGFTTDSKKIIVYDGTSKKKYIASDAETICASTQISDFTEAVQDVVGGNLIGDSTTLDGTYDDENGTFSLEVKNDAITLAKLDHGAQGDILYYASGGAPTRLGAGTSGQALITGGAGANPAWGALAEGKVTFTTTGGHAHTGSDSTKVTYTNLASIPSTFAPSAHGTAAHSGTIGDASQIAVGTFPASTSWAFAGASTLSITNTSAKQVQLAYDGSHYTNFQTNSSGALIIDTTGDSVGVDATPVPNCALTVNGVTFPGHNYAVQSNLYYSSGWKYNTNGYASAVVFPSAGGIRFDVTPENSSGPGASASVTTAMYLTSTGGIGINTTTPRRKLDVLDASNPQFRLTYTDNSVYTDFQTNSSGYLTISPSGGFTHLGGSRSGAHTLEVTQGAVDQNVAVFTVNSSRTAAGYVYGVYLKNTDSTVGNYTCIGNTTSNGVPNCWFEFVNVDHTYDGTIHAVTRNGVGGYTTKRMTILNTGNVGINTTTPRRKLDILDASDNPQFRLTYTDNSVYTDFTTNSSGYLTIAPSGGITSVTGVLNQSSSSAWQPISGITNTANDATAGTIRFYNSRGGNTTQTNDYIGFIDFQGYLSGGSVGAVIGVIQSGSASTKLPMDMYFSTGTSTAAPAERMRITSAGLLGVNTTTPRRKLDVLDASGNPQFRLSHTDNSFYTDFTTDSSGNLIIKATSGKVYLDATGSLTDNLLITNGTVLGTNADDTINLLRLTNPCDTGCNDQFKISHIRTTAGAAWFYATIRLQRVVDASLHGFIDFAAVASSQALQMGVGSTVYTTLSSTGLFGINTTTPRRKLDVLDASSNPQFRLTYTDNSVYTDCHTRSDGTLLIDPTGAEAFIDGVWAPHTDNTRTCGTGTNRWSAVYAVNGTIQTSDEREKNILGRCGLGLSYVNRIIPIHFTWCSNGEEHYGFSAQALEREAGNAYVPTDYDAKSDRYGLRTTELIPILWRAVQELSDRLAALEAA